MKIIKNANVIEDGIVPNFKHLLCDHANQYRFDCLVKVSDGDESEQVKRSYYLVEYCPSGEPPYLFSQSELPSKIKEAIEKYSGLEIQTFDQYTW